MFRFRIRDVLWLTVVVALGVGWGIDRSQLASRLDDRAHHWSLEAHLNRAALRDARERIEELESEMEAAGLKVADQPSLTIGELLDALEKRAP